MCGGGGGVCVCGWVREGAWPRWCWLTHLEEAAHALLAVDAAERGRDAAVLGFTTLLQPVHVLNLLQDLEALERRDGGARDDA